MRDAGNRGQSLVIAKGNWAPGRADACSHLVGVKPKPRTWAGSHAPRPQLLSVVIHPAPRNAPAPGDLGGGEHFLRALRDRCGRSKRAAQQLGKPRGQRVDRLRRKSQLADVRWRGAHRRFLPKGRWDGPPACLFQCSIRALAISM